VLQTKVENLPLRFVDYGQQIRAAHDHEGTSVGCHVSEVDSGSHHTAVDRHQQSQVLVHSLD
jgi:hypothetical protein